MCYTLDEIRHAVISAVDDYHSSGGSPSIKQVSLSAAMPTEAHATIPMSTCS